MLLGVIGTTLLMGLAGGPHCVAMCAAPCARMGQPLPLHAGRLIGYAALGAIAATAIGWFAQGTQWLAALRPLWALVQLLALLWGLVLLVSARQPAWPGRFRPHARGALGVGLAWVFLPCGLLYSAVAIAALTGDALAGATAMLAFGLGTTLWLLLAPWLLARAGRRINAWRQDAGTRLAGAALALMSGWALWAHATQRGPVLWC
ncbi:MAG: sulfite exporter TauE/SafE family protein [Acidovorax sp.]